jgi:thiol-disulfide isomerase/thioredoxin
LRFVAWLLFVSTPLSSVAQTVKTAAPASKPLAVRPEVRQPIDLTVGATLPDFAYTGFDGKPHHLSEIKANCLLLDFWATWCVGCVADLPSKIKVYEEFHSRGFEILGMNEDRPEIYMFQNPYKSPQDLVDKLHIAWPQARFDHELFDHGFKITSLPKLVLIDADRKILSTGQDEFPLEGESLSTTLQFFLPPR